MKYTSMRGQPLDVAKFLAKNQNEIAVGNASRNARGDLLGPGGKIIKTVEQLASEYYEKNPNAVRKVSLTQPLDQTGELPLSEQTYVPPTQRPGYNAPPPGPVPGQVVQPSEETLAALQQEENKANEKPKKNKGL